MYLLALFVVLIMRAAWTQCTMSSQSCSSKLIEINVVGPAINSANTLSKFCLKGMLLLRSDDKH